MAKALSDAEVLSICNSELTNASESSEIAEQRADALDRYLGEPYGDEVEGRSQIRTRETFETVEGMMPSLMRLFCEQDNLICFEPVGPEDEEQAQQETDVVNHIFWHENDGFWNLYAFCKDALLSKTGILKAWADDSTSVEREEYKGLSDIQLGQLLSDPYAEREIIEYELTEDGHHLVCRTTREGCDIKIVPVAPEEFGISRHARSPKIADASFSYCRFKKTLGELMGEGYDKDLLLTLPTDEGLAGEEEIARRNLEDEQEFSAAAEWTMRTVWVSECYLRIDRDGDDIPELLQVTMAGGGDDGQSGVLMGIEEIDSVPLFATPAVPITHKFYGLSIADIVSDLQEIQTTLLRQVLDNTYLANNGQTAANTDYVNIDDLLTRRPGGLVRFQGEVPWNAAIGPIPHNQLPAQTSELFERLDERQKRRTGYGDEVAALDVKSLSNVNTGVAAMAFDMARAKIELLARVIAEIGLKPLFHHIHELMIKNKYQRKAVRIRNRWIETDPSSWKTRKDSTVTVGIGLVSRERKILGAEAILDKQRALAQEGAMGTIVMPHHVYEANKTWAEAWGFEPDLFFQDPRKLPPPPPKEPDPQALLAQAQGQALMMDGQSKMMRAQTEQQRLQIDAMKAQREAEYKAAEVHMKGEIERLRAQSALMKQEMESGAKITSMEHESQMRDVDRQIEMMGLQLTHLKAERDRDLEYYKAITTAAVSGQMPESPEEMEARQIQEQEMEAEKVAKEAAEAQKAMEAEMREGQRDAMVTRMFEEMRAMLEAASAPKAVEYDEKGLMKAFGGKPVLRDESGRVLQVG